MSITALQTMLLEVEHVFAAVGLTEPVQNKFHEYFGV